MYDKSTDLFKSKLDELKSRAEKFDLSLHNGADEIQDYCILLRNQVHLQTDILLEKVHQFNEKLIARIDQYEKDSIDAFENKTIKREHEFRELLSKMNQLYSKSSKYLVGQLKIDDAQIAESLNLVDDYLNKLTRAETLVKSVKFGNQIMHFKKRQ